MSNNKVTQKMLMEMVEEMLNENVNLAPKSTDQAWKHTFGSPEDRTAGMKDAEKLFDLLSKVKDPQNKLDKEDIEYFINVKDEEKLKVYRKLDTNMERALYLMKALPQIYKGLGKRIFYSAKGNFVPKSAKFEDELVTDEKTAEQILKDLDGTNGLSTVKKISSEKQFVQNYIHDTKEVLENFQNFPNIERLASLATTAIKQFYEFQSLVSKDIDQTLTSPKIDSAAAERGVFPKSQIEIVKRLLTGATFGDRMKQVNDISIKYNKASKATTKEEIDNLIGNDPSQILTEIMLLDLFNLLLRATSTEQARYGFEALLALIAGGSQEGATLMASGTQGVADFVDDKGNPGSAKLYKAGDKKIDQSLANFKLAAKDALKDGDKTDFQVHYVIGLKKQGAEQLGVDNLSRGSGSPSKNVVLEVHEPIIGIDVIGLYVIPSGKEEKIYYNDNKLKLIDGGRIRLDTSLPFGESTGQIYVTGSRVETFRTYIGNILDQQEGEAKQMLDFFKKFIESIEMSKEKSKAYIASKDSNDAEQTLQNLDDSKNNFNSIKALMDQFYSSQEPPALQESKKITASMLRKIIEENFKK